MKHPKCTLGSIVDPGQYFLLSTDTEHQSDIKLLEDAMTKEMNGFNCSATADLSLQMCVAVRDSNFGNLKRGVIQRKFDDDLYEVFLIDYGYPVTVERKHIKIFSNKDFMDVEPLAFTLKLYGILPCVRCPLTGAQKIKKCMKWSQEAEHFVRNVFEENPEILVKLIFLKERTVYGDLQIKLNSNSRYVSLRKLLREKEFCAYSESHFLRIENLEGQNESLKSDDKMELVGNWQKENFGSNSSLNSNLESSLENSPAPVVSSYFDVLQRRDLVKCSDGSSGNSCPSLGKGRGRLRDMVFNMRLKKAGLGRGELVKNQEEGRKNSDLKTECSTSLSSVNDSYEKIFSDGEENFGNKLVEVVNSSEKESVNDATEKSSSENVHLNFRPDSKNELHSKAVRHQNDESSSSESKLEFLRQKSLFAVTSDFWMPFIIFSDSVVEPVNTFRELPIQPSIIWNLEKRGSFNNLSQVQRWAIPSIRKQHNTVVIGSSKTGKTLSYIVPLMDYIQDETFFDELPEGNGPALVIVTSSSRVCESIYHLCQELLGSFEKHKKFSKVKIVLAHGGCETDVWVDLTNGCDVLITTPHCLVRLLEMPVLTNFERLACLVLDQIDVISQKPFLNSVRIILEKAKFNTKERHFQKILCGEKWTPGVESLIQSYVKFHALIIGSYLEAVVYDRLKPNIVLVERERKPEVLIEKVKEKIEKAKTLVFCEIPAEAVSVHKLITDEGISAMVAHEDLMADVLREIGKAWNNCPTHWVLVLTDGVLSELKIEEAQALIHYSLPFKSKTNFYLRYAAFQKYLRDNCVSLGSPVKKGRLPLSDTILIDDENHYQLPHIVDFVSRLGGKLPPKILQKCEEIRRLIEVGKRDSPICKNLLTLGRCKNCKDCPRRHAFVKDLDLSDNLPSKGWVSFKVIKVLDAACFSARLIEHVSVDGNSSKLGSSSLEIPLKLSEFYKAEHNRRPHGMPEAGDICAIKTEVLDQEVFLRAQIVAYAKLDKHEKPVEVIVRLMDEGGFRKQKSIDLYELPEELRKLPAGAVDIKLVGVQPLDFDVNWNQVANTFIENLMTQKLEENQYWSGKIVLTLKDTLFLDPIKRKQFLPVLNTHVFDLVLHEELINNKMAVKNHEHLPALLKLCAEAEMEVSSKGESKKEDCVKVQPQWAFFDQDFLEVKFLAAEHTSRIFLQPKKFQELLEELEDDCQKEGERTAQEFKSRKSKNLPVVNLSVGMFCLARFEDGKWNRGRIEAVDGNRFYVFFVDHGDFLFIPKADVVSISRTLLLRLPCQAVECRLVGIKDQEEECPLEILQEIYRFSDDGRDNLFAYIIRKDLKAEITNGRKYSLNLLNNKGISLNKWLVEKKEIIAEESERNYLEDIEIELPQDEENEEEEDKEEDNWDKEAKNIRNETKELVPMVQESPHNYFLNFTDEMFEDEAGQEFLKEFASKVLSSLKPPELRAEIPKEKTKLPPKVEEKITVTEKTKRLMELHKKRVRKGKVKVELKSREGILTPRVLWSQNQIEVQLKILLGNVEDYSVECTATNFSFRCFLGEKFYGVDLKLYGGINPQMTKLTPKAFHVVVQFVKLASPLWPRLQRDEGKLWWINLDVESLIDHDGPFADRIESVKRDMASGRLKKPIRDDQIFSYTDSEDSDLGDSNSEDSENNY